MPGPRMRLLAADVHTGHPLIDTKVEGRKMRLVGLALAIAVGFSRAQTGAAARMEFEVASVKPSKPGTPGTSVHYDRSGLTASNASLQVLIHAAYQVEAYQISGAPSWLDSQKFDIVAKVPTNTPMADLGAQLRPRLQALLLDRFKLAIHHETKMVPAYALVVTKTGSKLHKSTVEDEGIEKALFTGRRGDLTAQRITVAQIAEMLAREVDSPVSDLTGIQGVFEMHLEWAPQSSQAVSKPVESGARPSIFSAIQEQLGLKLEARKAQLDVLVIDHVEKVPSEN